MASRKKRSRGLKRAIVTAAVLAGGAAGAGCRPMVCDPAPPPSTAPRPTGAGTVTPMICDPPPPPTVAPRPTRTPTRPMICDPLPPPSTLGPKVTPFKTPMICDPAPAPSLSPRGQATTTPIAARRFRAQSVEISADPALVGARVEGTVLDGRGRPLAGLWVAVEAPNYRMQVLSDERGAFAVPLPGPGAYQVTAGDDQAHALALELKAHERATVVWEEVVQATLPLAEIREVRITWQGGLAFAAETPWPGARCTWSVSGGALAGVGEVTRCATRLRRVAEGVAWQPPAEPGRYLLQVVADWGAVGLAVDARILTVQEGGRIVV